MLGSGFVSSGISHATASVQRVLLLGPDDDARRALHLMLDRAGKQVAAMAELDGARRYLAANDVRRGDRGRRARGGSSSARRDRRR